MTMKHVFNLEMFPKGPDSITDTIKHMGILSLKERPAMVGQNLTLPSLCMKYTVHKKYLLTKNRQKCLPDVLTWPSRRNSLLSICLSEYQPRFTRMVKLKKIARLSVHNIIYT